MNVERSVTSAKKNASSGNEDAGGCRWRNAGVGGRRGGGGAPGAVATAGTRVAAGAVGDAAGNGDQVGPFGGGAVAVGIPQSSIVGAGSSGLQFGTLAVAPCCSARCSFGSFLSCSLPSSPPLTLVLKSSVAGSLSLGCWPGCLRLLGSLQWDFLSRTIGFASGWTPQSRFCFLQSSWHRPLC